MRVAVITLSLACALIAVALLASRDRSTVAAPVQTSTPRATARAMPRVATPVGFSLPSSCSLSDGGAAVRTGENGSLIHWIAVCAGASASEMPPTFGSALAKQGWTAAAVTPADVPQTMAAYRRGDLELLFEFSAPGQPASNYVWFAERYWH